MVLSIKEILSRSLLIAFCLSIVWSLLIFPFLISYPSIQWPIPELGIRGRSSIGIEAAKIIINQYGLMFYLTILGKGFLSSVPLSLASCLVLQWQNSRQANL